MNYDMIDRFLRNNLGDDDYAEYSAALDSLCAPQRTWVGLTEDEIFKLYMNSGCTDIEDCEGFEKVAKVVEAKLKERNA